MKQLFQILLITLVASACVLFKNTSQMDTSQVIYTETDKHIFENIVNSISEKSVTDLSELIISIGKLLKETPYAGQTLDLGNNEKLIINLRELDCTTFAENCLAISRTIKSKNLSFERYFAELQNIRYRNGKLEEYPSRLHYFSDWIYNNEQKGLIRDVSKEIANTIYPNKVDFMSTHVESYKQLNENEEFVKKIIKQENAISQRTVYYIPEEKLDEVEAKFSNGDIVGITTNIKGLDVAHVGILIRVNGHIHLLHASSVTNKVVISDETLEEYLLNNKSSTGIMVARPI